MQNQFPSTVTITTSIFLVKIQCNKKVLKSHEMSKSELVHPEMSWKKFFSVQVLPVDIKLVDLRVEFCQW